MKVLQGQFSQRDAQRHSLSFIHIHSSVFCYINRRGTERSTSSTKFSMAAGGAKRLRRVSMASSVMPYHLPSFSFTFSFTFSLRRPQKQRKHKKTIRADLGHIFGVGAATPRDGPRSIPPAARAEPRRVHAPGRLEKPP